MKNGRLLFACVALLGMSDQPVLADDKKAALCVAAKLPDAPRVIHTTLAGVPALLRIPSRAQQAPVVLWHGFGPPDSESALMQALPLDDVPAIKVYLGLPDFGKRALPGGMGELARRQQEDVALNVFEPVVLGAALELQSVVAALLDARCARPNEAVALVGFSAGAAAVLIALAERNVAIDAAVTLNASTGLSDSVAAFERALKRAYSWNDRSRALANRTDAVKRATDIARSSPALLLIHGTDDAMLPTQRVQALYDALRPDYAKHGHAARLELDLMEDLRHDITAPAAARELNVRVSQWLIDHRSTPASR